MTESCDGALGFLSLLHTRRLAGIERQRFSLNRYQRMSNAFGNLSGREAATCSAGGAVCLLFRSSWIWSVFGYLDLRHDLDEFPISRFWSTGYGRKQETGAKKNGNVEHHLRALCFAMCTIARSRRRKKQLNKLHRSFFATQIMLP